MLALCLCYEMLTHSILLLYRLKHQAPLLLLHAASARQLTHSFRCLLRVGALVFLGLGLMLGVGLGSGRCGIKSHHFCTHFGLRLGFLQSPLGLAVRSMRHKISATFVLISGCDLASCDHLLVFAFVSKLLTSFLQPPLGLCVRW